MVNYHIRFVSGFGTASLYIDGSLVGQTVQSHVYTSAYTNGFLDIPSKSLSSGNHSISWSGDSLNDLQITNLDLNQEILEVEGVHFNQSGLWFDETGLIPATVNSGNPNLGWKGYAVINPNSPDGIQSANLYDLSGNLVATSSPFPLDPTYYIVSSITASYDPSTNTINLPSLPSTPPITSYDVVIEATNGKTISGTMSSQDYQKFSSSIITLISGGSQFSGQSFITSSSPSSSVTTLLSSDIINFLLANINNNVINTTPVNPVNNTTAPVNEPNTQPQQTSLGQPLLNAPIPNPPSNGSNVITDVLLPNTNPVQSVTIPNIIIPNVTSTNVSTSSIGSSLQNMFSGSGGIVLILVVVVILALVMRPKSQQREVLLVH